MNKQDLARHLGFTVDSPFSDENRFYLVAPNGMQLFVREARNKKDSLEISLSLPSVNDQWEVVPRFGQKVTIWGETMPSMGISKNKTSEQIAQSIKNRILPECERIYGLALQQISNYKNALNQKASLFDSLQEVFKGEMHKEYLYRASAAGYCYVRPQQDTVNFEVSRVPKEKALQLAEFLKTLLTD